MTDAPKKFKSTERAFEDLTASLDKTIDELTRLLTPEVDCLSCGNEDGECPDCYEDTSEEETKGDV